MVHYRAVGGLVLEAAVGGDQHAGHHGQRAGCSGYKVAHHIAVIVLAGPYDAAFRAYYLCRNVIYEGVAVAQARLLKGLAVFLVKNLLEEQLEGLVIVFGYGILGGKPYVLLYVKGVGEAAAGEGQNRIVPVVHGLQNTGAFEVEYGLAAKLTAVLICEQQLGFAGELYSVLNSPVYIAVGVAGYCDGPFPAGHHRLYL